MDGANPTAGFTWLFYALLTVVFWGLYGVLLHTGQMAMADPLNGRYKAFLLVGIAYLICAVIGAIVVLFMREASWVFPPRGIGWSLLAGAVGAFGAFGVLLAFGSKGSPAVVMSIVFAGAPIVNAITSFALHPRSLSAIRWPFIAGILMAAIGGFLVTLYRPSA